MRQCTPLTSLSLSQLRHTARLQGLLALNEESYPQAAAVLTFSHIALTRAPCLSAGA